MSTLLTLDSARLRLRPWRDSDLPAFAALNADPQVMRYFPALMTAEESRAQAERIRAFMQQHGWGLWAVEVKGGAPFIGFVGLARPGDDLPCSPCVEIGWRLAAAHWGNGYAAGYYAYLWTEMLADDAFQWFTEHGGLTAENGQRFRDMILSRGNSQDLEKLYIDWRGKEPSIEPMLINRGLKDE